MRFRGREVTHPEIGREILMRLSDSVEDYGVIESMPKLEGRQMTMVLAPAKRQPVAYEDAAAEAEQPED
jgi:translation initiation factor IF-3